MITSKKDLLEDLDNFEKKLQDLEKKLNENTEYLNRFGQGIIKLDDKINDKVKELNESINSFADALVELNERINDLEDKYKKDYETLQKSIEEMKKELKQKIIEEIKQNIKLETKIDQSGKENEAITQEFSEVIDQGSFITENPEIETETNPEEELEDLESEKPEEPEDPNEKLLLDFLKDPHSFKELMDFAYQNHFSLSRIFQKLQQEGKVKKTDKGLWIRS